MSCEPQKARRTHASYIVHKDPASSAASRWTLENMYRKHPDGVQEKLGGQPVVEL